MASVQFFVAVNLWIATATISNCLADDVPKGEDKLILVIYSSLSDFDMNVAATLNESAALMAGNLKLEFHDLNSSSCDDQTISTLSVLIQTHMFNKDRSVIGIVGPSCTDAAFAVAKLIKRSQARVGHIHTSPMPLPMLAKVHNSTWGLRTPVDLLANASTELIKYANWSQVLALHHDTLTDMNYVFQLFQRQLEDWDCHNNTISSGKSCDEINKTHLSSIPLQNSPLHFKNILLVHSVRILFLMLDAELARNKLCQAFMLKAYYPAYQWVIVKMALSDLLVKKVYMESYVCDKKDILRVLKNAVFINFQFGTCFLSSSNIKQDKSSKESISSLYKCSIQAMTTILNNTDTTSHLADDGTTGFDYESLPTYPRKVSIEQIQNNKLVPIFLYSTLTSSLRILSENIFLISSELRIDIRVVNLPVAIPFFGINFMILVVSVILQVITLRFRQEKSVKSSSPVLLHYCYIGIYMLNLMTNTYFITKSFVLNSDSIYINLCRTSITMFGFGLTIVFGTLTMKTWRLYKIFVHYMNPGKYLSDSTLVFFVCCLTLVDLVVIVTWFVFDPLKRVYYEVDRNNLDGIITNQAVCDSELYLLLFLLLIGYQLLIMAVMVWLMCNVRKNIPKVYTNLQTSNSEMKLVYILLFLLSLGIPGYWVVHSLLHNFLLEFVMMGVIFCSVQVSFVLLLLLPPIILVLKSRNTVPI